MPRKLTNDKFQDRLKQLRESGLDVYTDDEFITVNDSMEFYCSHGHKWPAIATVVLNNHSGCPYCCGQKTLREESLLQYCKDNKADYIIEQFAGVDDKGN